MIVYRICPSDYANDISGTGAKLYGGRWNSEGLKALYTSSSRALALLEILVHADFATLQNRVYKVLEIKIPEENLSKFNINKLSPNWNNDFIQAETQEAGDVFLTRKEYLTLEVPSVILPDEMNFILNPEHLSFEQVEIISTKTLEIGKRVLKAL